MLSMPAYSRIKPNSLGNLDLELIIVFHVEPYFTNCVAIWLKDETLNIPTSSAPRGFCTSAIRLWRMSGSDWQPTKDIQRVYWLIIGLRTDFGGLQTIIFVHVGDQYMAT